MFLSMKLCYCISIDRAMYDKIYFNNTPNCSDIANSHGDNNTCKCNEGDGEGVSIVSIISSKTECVPNENFDDSKNICLVHHSTKYFIFNKNCKLFFHCSNRKFLSLSGTYEI